MKQATKKPVGIMKSRGRPKSSDPKQTRPLRVDSRWESWQQAVPGSPYATLNELIVESVERELRRLKSPFSKPKP